jgi:hypothetical protein
MGEAIDMPWAMANIFIFYIRQLQSPKSIQAKGNNAQLAPF